MVTMAVVMSTVLLTSAIAFSLEQANALSMDKVKDKIKNKVDPAKKKIKDRLGGSGGDSGGGTGDGGPVGSGSGQQKQIIIK